MVERASTPAEVDAFQRGRYQHALNFVKGKRVLDVACGIGYGSAMMKERGALSVLGVDIAPEAIAVARAHYEQPDVQFQVADCFAVEGVYDVVVSLETIEHLEDGFVWPAKIARLLAQEGMAVISTPVRRRGALESPPANPYHRREWSQSEFLRLLAASFAQVDLLYQGLLLRDLSGSRTVRAPKRLFSAYALWRQVISSKQSVLTADQWFAEYGFWPAYMVGICRKSAPAPGTRSPGPGS